MLSRICAILGIIAMLLGYESDTTILLKEQKAKFGNFDYICEQFVSCIENNNPSLLTDDLFAPKAKENNPSITEELYQLISCVKGDIKSWERDYQLSRDRSDGNGNREYYQDLIVDLYTTEYHYRFLLGIEVMNSGYPEEAGLRFIRLYPAQNYGYNREDDPEFFELTEQCPIIKTGKIENYKTENPISEKEEIKIYWNYILEYFGLK